MDISAIDEALYAELEAEGEADRADVTEEGEPQGDVEDEDLEIEADMVTFENAAFVFLEALKEN